MRWLIRRWLTRLFVLLIAVLVLFFVLRSKYRLVIEDLAQTQVKNTTSDLTNDAIAKQIADRYNLVFVPLQDKFDKLANETKAEDWLYDGVHPGVGGHEMIANELVKALGL